MTPIPLSIRHELEGLERMERCARESLECSGRLEWHHAIQMGGRRLQEAWAILPACVYHHRLSGKNDEHFRHLAYQNISEEALSRYKTGAQMIVEKNYLKQKYVHRIPRG